MDSPSYPEQREVLIESIERDQQELRQAVQELTGAASMQMRIGEHIKRAPVQWLLGGFVFGLWLGSRRRRIAS